MRDRAPTSRGEVHDALAAARRTATSGGAGPAGRVLALQRRAGNAAVSALLAAKLKAPGGEAVGKIDAALREVDGSDPDVGKVEAGLKAAKEAGVPVDIDGAAQKPPPSALAVTTTGFGPGQVKPQPSPPPKKPVPAKSPLGKVAKKAPAVGPAKKGGAPAAPKPAGPAPASAAGSGGVAAAPLSGDQLLQPPVPPTPVPPGADPAFAAVTAKAGAVAKATKAHPPASAKAKEAQEAAVAPADDAESQAKAAKADTMDAQQPGTFDKKKFIAAVKAAIEAKSPKTLKEADEYKKSGKAEEVKGDVQGMVGQGKDEQAKDITEATEASPDPSKAVEKPVTPMKPEQPGPVGTVPAAGAAPKPAPPEQVNLEAGKHQANQEMADAEVSEKQLAESNEPEFNQALADKKQAAQHADTAPGEYRKAEQEVIGQSKAEAAATTAAAVTGMHGSKAQALAAVVADKQKTRSKDEQKRAEVTAKIKSIYDATEAEVKKILDGIDPKVEDAFGKGEQKARQEFEAFVAQKMAAYKKDRYGGWLGGIRWAKDKLFGMPDKVNEFFQAGRELYLKRMDEVISSVADIVGGDLTKAKQRIAQGRQEIAAYVKSLPADLQKVGSEAAGEIADKFDQLTSDVDAKQDALVDTLATKYTEARQGLDARIEELQAENKGLVDKAIGAIKAVINTIRQLASMLKNVLARAAGVVGDIIKAPVAFLGNLIAGVKGGILRFKDNILDHLKKGLMGWLFGALAEGGVELPETFDIKGIIKLLASIFGLTWANIRNRLVKQIGEPAMAAVEKGVDIFQKLGSQGVAGLWDLLLEKLGDIKEMILEKVKDFVVTRIITAGITWLIGLLNPAAAFIKACKLIYDVVMFFIQNGERIMKFVNTVLDSVADIVRGNVSGVVAKIENVLGQMVPILIGFLASVIGLGGIGQKVREIVQTLQKPVNKALDFVIKQGLKLAGPIIRGLKGIGAKAKAKIAAGKAYVKGKVEKGKARLAAGVRSVGEKLGIIKKPFAMKGEAHTLTLTANGEIEMASRRPRKLGGLLGTVLKSVEARKKAMAEAKAKASEIEAKGKKAGKREKELLAEINTYLRKADEFLADVRQIDTLRRQIERSRAANPKSLLARLSNLLESLGARFNLADLGPLAPPDPKVIGTIAPYEDLKKGRVNELGTGEAEHVTPGATIEQFIRGWNRNKVFYVRGSGADSVYKKDITILIPKRMADIKTDLGAAREASDQDVIRRIKDAMTEARALNAKVKRGGKPTKQQQAQFDALAKRAGSINELVMSRVALTIAARKQYVQELRQGKAVGLPPGMKPAQAIKIIEEQCSDAKINQAALEQLANVWSLDPLG